LQRHEGQDKRGDQRHGQSRQAYVQDVPAPPIAPAALPLLLRDGERLGLNDDLGGLEGLGMMGLHLFHQLIHPVHALCPFDQRVHLGGVPLALVGAPG